MQAGSDAYEVVVGLEVHAQLLTQSKLFSGDSIAFGAEPNTNISPISLAHPGVLPKMNGKAIELAVKMGLACGCEIVTENFFARKNYFYPDLPKGYQLSQHTTPICKAGSITINVGGAEKVIRLNRIHIEEDAGKSLHDVNPQNTALDFNRAGTPLIEIVTEPDIRSGEEAANFLIELRRLVRYLDVCDGNMEEGSIRCDANVSVRKTGDTTLGTKVEVKNLNSIKSVRRAIELEAMRMINIIEEGGLITQQTRSFDADKGMSFSMRDKEDAEDYRYFPEPDLAKFYLTEGFIGNVRASIPVLQQDRVKKYKEAYQLSIYDASALAEDKDFADYFEKIIQHTNNYKAAANWMLGPIRSWLNENSQDIRSFPIGPGRLAALIIMIDEGQISFSIAAAKLFPALLAEPTKEPIEIARKKDLVQSKDLDALDGLVTEVLNNLPGKVNEYKKGKKGLIGVFVKEVMKLSKGKADPKIVNDLLIEKLK